MKSDLIMTSSFITEKFIDIYNDFFASNDLIVSWNNILTWWVWISHWMNLLRIKQKVPTKTYCWIKLNSSWKVKFNKIFSFNVLEQVFEDLEYSKIYSQDSERIQDFIEQYLKDNWFNKWIEFNFLWENPRWHWFWFSWVSSTLIAFIIYLVLEKIDLKVLEDYDNFSKMPIFEELHRFSWKISQCMSYWKSSWSTNHTVMINDWSPQIYFTEAFKLKPKKELCDDKNCIENFKELDNVFVYKDKIINFLWIWNNINELPIDYWIIFTGFEHTFKEIEAIQENIMNSNKKLKDFIQKKLQYLNLKNLDNFNFSSFFKEDENEVFLANINDINFKLLSWFSYIFENIYDDESAEKFVDIIRIYWLINYFYEKKNKLFADIQYLFNKNKTYEDEVIWLCPFNIGKSWWSMLFTMKYNKSRETLKKVIEILKNEWNWNIFLEYASWRDWNSSDWLKLEQYIKKQVFSRFIKEDSLLFIDNKWKTYVWDYDSILENEKTWLLLDKIKWKIYLNWEKLTSQDLSSQTATIDLLETLLLKEKEGIFNKDLPIPSYSKNKNEMIGKIILPLVKLIENKTWKRINIICSWSLSDFYMKLGNDNLRISTIKKLVN